MHYELMESYGVGGQKCCLALSADSRGAGISKYLNLGSSQRGTVFLQPLYSTRRRKRENGILLNLPKNNLIVNNTSLKRKHGRKCTYMMLD